MSRFIAKIVNNIFFTKSYFDYIIYILFFINMNKLIV